MKRLKAVCKPIAGLLAVVCLGTALLCSAPMPVEAASTSDLKKQVDSLKNEKKDIDSQIKSLEKKISGNKKEIKSIQAEKETIDRQVALMSRQIENLNQQVSACNQLIADKQAEVLEAQAKVNALNEKHKERIRAMEEDGTLTYWSVLFKSSSFADLLDRMTIIEEIAAADRRRLQEMSDAAKVLADAKAELQAEKDEAQNAADDLAAGQAALEDKRKASDALLSQLNAKGKQYQDLLEDQEDEQAKILKSIAQAEKAYNDSQKGKNKDIPSSSGWLVPCTYRRLSSPFGMRVHPITGVNKMHYGVDLAGASGTPIKASRSGVVTAATFQSSMGNYVSINHGDGYSSIYMHMTHSIVKVGEIVYQGQVIGYMGSTGASTGPHLHFGISKNGTYVNPANYINIK